MNRVTLIAAAVRQAYGLKVTEPRWVWAGPHTDHVMLTNAGGDRLLACAYRRGADLRQIRRDLGLGEWLRLAGLPTARVLAAGDDEPRIELLPTVAVTPTSSATVSVHDIGGMEPCGPLDAETAAAAGALLARLHRAHAARPLMYPPVFAEPARVQDVAVLAARHRQLLDRIGPPPRGSDPTATTAFHIQRRLTLLSDVPQLRRGLAPLQLAPIHGTLTTTDLYRHRSRLTAIGTRPRFGDRVRELAVLAYDSATVTAGPGWPDLAEAVIGAYLDHGGPVPPAATADCPGLATLHHLWDLDTITDRHRRQLPTRLAARVDSRFADATAVITALADGAADLRTRLHSRFRDGHGTGVLGILGGRSTVTMI